MDQRLCCTSWANSSSGCTTLLSWAGRWRNGWHLNRMVGWHQWMLDPMDMWICNAHTQSDVTHLPVCDVEFVSMYTNTHCTCAWICTHKLIKILCTHTPHTHTCTQTPKYTVVHVVNTYNQWSIQPAPHAPYCKGNTPHWHHPWGRAIPHEGVGI